MALPGMEAAPRPEWPGAVSSKFSDAFTGKPSSKRIVETGVRDGPQHSVARNGLGPYFTDTAGLAPTQGLRTFAERERASDVCEWRPSRRCVSEPGQQHYEKSEGRRIVEQPPRRVAPLREKRHLRQVSSKEEAYDRPAGPKGVFRDNGLHARDQPAREVDLSMEMQRKVRPLDLSSQRNGLDCRSLGDKPYRHPEYQKGFHQVGGLIVGSGFLRGTYKKTEPRNSSNVQLVLKDTGPLKSYAEAQRELQLREAEAEVEALTKTWEASTLKECDPRYEELSDSGDEQEAYGGEF